MLVSNVLSVAVFRMDNGCYGLFDSHERGPSGKLCTGGKSVLTIHNSIQSLVHTVDSNCGVNPRGSRLDIYGFSLGNRSNIVSDVRDIIVGNFAQNNEHFADFSRNRQCTGNSVAAIITAANVPLSGWEPDTLDSILIMGDHLYKTTRDRNTSLADNYVLMDPSEIALEFTYGGVRYELERNMMFQGDNREAHLADALGQFFIQCHAGVLVSHTFSVAVFRMDNGLFGLFDSHERDSSGRHFTGGNAVLTMHASIQSLVHTVECNFGVNPQESQFRIYSFSLRNFSNTVSPVQETFLEVSDNACKSNRFKAPQMKETKKERQKRLDRERKQRKKLASDASIIRLYEKKRSLKRSKDGTKSDYRNINCTRTEQRTSQQGTMNNIKSDYRNTNGTRTEERTSQQPTKQCKKADYRKKKT